MPDSIKLAADLDLPENAVTQKFAFIAQSGGGKTYAAGKLVEELLAGEGEALMAYELHVFIGRDGEPHAALTLPDGHRTSPRKLSKRHRAMLIELRNLLELYDLRKALRKPRRGDAR